MFKVGDKVKWLSQAAAYGTIKEGVVKGIIAADEAPKPRYFPGHSVMFDGDGSPRGHESYLIEVPGGRDGQG